MIAEPIQLSISSGEKSIVSEGTGSFIGLWISVMKGVRRS